MAYQHVFTANVRNLCAGHSAGKSSFVFPAQILRAIAHRFTVNGFRYTFQRRKRRENHDFIDSTVRFGNQILGQFDRFDYGLVHLPVTGHKRAPHLIQRLHTRQHFAFQIFQRSAATGGNVADFIFQTNLLDSRYAVAAAYDADCIAVRNGFGNRFRSFTERIHFEYAHRPVPNYQFGIFYRICIQFAGFRTDIQGHVILVQIIQRRHFIHGIRFEFCCHHQIYRQKNLNILHGSFCHNTFSFFNLIVFYQRLAHRDTSGRKECIGHAAANQQRIHFAQQVYDYADLIRNFCAADDSGKRMLRIIHSIADKTYFLFQQETCRAGQEMGYAFHRCMSPVRYAETVIYIQICQGSQLLRKFQIIFLFFFMVTQVL